MDIETALQSTGIPVSGLPYEGRADTYVTHQLIGQTAIIYAEGREAATAVQHSVDLWTGVDYRNDLRSIKTALEAAGYIVQVETEDYDADIGRTHVMMTATMEGVPWRE